MHFRQCFRYVGMCIAILLTTSAVVFAQSGEVTETVAPLRAVMTGPDAVEVGKTIVLDASLSTADPETVAYLWMLDGQVMSTDAEVLLTVDEPGTYDIKLVVRDRLKGDLRRAELSRPVTVYLRKVALVAGPTIDPEKLTLHQETSREVGTFLSVLHAKELAIPLGLEDAMTQLMTENMDQLLSADAIVLWTDDAASAMNALSRALQQDTDTLSLLETKTIVLISDSSLPALARIVRGPFSVLQPARIVITRRQAINPLIEAVSIDDFLASIERSDIDFQILDETTTAIRPWNLLSSLVNFMVSRGVNSRMIILLLLLPVILTIITFLKQVIGVTTFGLYTPAVIALSLLALGWQIGLALLFIIIVVSYLTRAYISRYRLLYIPKIAVILTVTSIALMVVLAIAAAFDILLAPDTIFILLIMTTLSEEFMSVKAEQGLRSAIFAISETVLVSLVCFAIVQWSFLRSLILAYPELIILTLVANVFLGRWTGLRVSEMLRFKEIFKYLEE